MSLSKRFSGFCAPAAHGKTCRTNCGNWHSTYVRFARWRDSGVWERVADVLGGDADMEQLFIDSTIVRAHQHSAGAQKKRVVRKSAARAAD